MIMRAAEAMENAIMYARDGIDLERARIWLDIARELREEAAARQMYSRMWSLTPEPTAEAAPAPAPDWFVSPVVEASDTAERTEVLRPGSAETNVGRCKHCGYFIRQTVIGLVHTRTEQAVCPISVADGTHRFAESEVGTVDVWADQG